MIKDRERESNLELLRLACMFYIVLLHFMEHGLKITGHGLVDGPGTVNIAGIISESFVVIAVNCFVLISGYFGINAKWKGIFHLWIMCSFYYMIFGLLDIHFNQLSVKEFLLHTFLPFTHTYGLWFVPCYVLLYILSPVLNKVAESVNKRQFVVLLLLISILVFYYGYLFNKWSADSKLLLFIFLYLIGRFIKLHIVDKHKSSRKRYFLIYLICSLMIAGIGIGILNVNNIPNKWISLFCFPYNSPLVVISAVAFFLFFRSLHFQSKLVNWAASSAFAIYLIHENTFMHKVFVRYISELGKSMNNGFLLALSLIAIALVVLITCILIDKLRMLITNPVERLFNRINWQGYSNKLIERVMRLMDKL
jgi:surface polysaccharide O-acyltransferase-like enzyme